MTTQASMDRRVTVTSNRPSKADVIALYRTLTMAYFAEAFHLRHDNPDAAFQAEQLRIRTNQTIMGAI